MEAPEKLYLSKNIYSTYLYQVPDPDDETAVEYTRTDAFIEKAISWLKGNYLKYPSEDCADTTKFVVDFRKYMKGE